MGVDLAEVNFTMNRAYVYYDSEITNPSSLESAVETVGFEAHRLRDNDDVHEPSEQSEHEYLKLRIKLWLALRFSIPLVLLAMGPLMGIRLPFWMSSEEQLLSYGLIQLLLTLPVLWAGRDFYSKGFSSFLHRNPNTDTLVAIGTATAVGYSLWKMFDKKLDAGVFF